MFEGAHTALITPFNSDRELDETAFRKLIDEQFDNGISGIVLSAPLASPPLSTTRSTAA